MGAPYAILGLKGEETTVKATHKRTQFAALGVVMAMMILGVLVFTGWYAYHSQQVANTSLQSANKVSRDIPKVAPITTFDACKKAAGSKMLQTYPEQCVTKAGKSFTDTTQAQYMVIKEWNVKMPLTANIRDAYYVINPDLPSAAYLSLTSLKNTSCSASDITLASINRFTAQDMDKERGVTILSEHPTATKVGNYYYSPVFPQAACDTGKVQLPQNVSFRQEFGQAISLMQAN
jgi:hypothetical protein